MYIYNIVYIVSRVYDCIYTMYCMHYSTCVGGGPVIVEDERLL